MSVIAWYATWFTLGSWFECTFGLFVLIPVADLHMYVQVTGVRTLGSTSSES